MCSCWAASISPETSQKHDNFKKTKAGVIFCSGVGDVGKTKKKESGKKQACCKLVFFKVSRAVNLALKITNWQNEVLHKYYIKDPGLYAYVECTAKKIDKWLNFVSL